jgi:hypothetical protein
MAKAHVVAGGGSKWYLYFSSRTCLSTYNLVICHLLPLHTTWLAKAFYGLTLSWFHVDPDANHTRWRAKVFLPHAGCDATPHRARQLSGSQLYAEPMAAFICALMFHIKGVGKAGLYSLNGHRALAILLTPSFVVMCSADDDTAPSGSRINASRTKRAR